MTKKKGDQKLGTENKPITNIEPAKWIPIGISLLALVISSLSLWESNRGRMMNEETNRPKLSLNGVTPSPSTVFVSDTDKTVVWFTVKLKNTGKTTAIVDRPRIQPFLLFETGDCKIDDSGFMQSPQNLNILSESEESVTYRVAIAGPQCGQRPKLFLGMRIVVTYTDAGSGKQYSQDLNGDVVDIEVRPDTKQQTQPKRRQRRSSEL